METGVAPIVTGPMSVDAPVAGSMQYRFPLTPLDPVAPNRPDAHAALACPGESRAPATATAATSPTTRTGPCRRRGRRPRHSGLDRDEPQYLVADPDEV